MGVIPNNNCSASAHFRVLMFSSAWSKRKAASISCSACSFWAWYLTTSGPKSSAEIMSLRQASQSWVSPLLAATSQAFNMSASSFCACWARARIDQISVWEPSNLSNSSQVCKTSFQRPMRSKRIIWARNSTGSGGGSIALTQFAKVGQAAKVGANQAWEKTFAIWAPQRSRRTWRRSW